MRLIFKAIYETIFGPPKPEAQSGNDDAVLNVSLALAQEWGSNLLQPVQARLSKVYPGMSHAELDNYNSIAQAAMRFAHHLVYALAEQYGRDKVSEEIWRERVLRRYPWVDETNLRHLFSTGNYYAWKDMG